MYKLYFKNGKVELIVKKVVKGFGVLVVLGCMVMSLAACPARTHEYEAPETKYCKTPGCPRETRNGRDYCSAHKCRNHSCNNEAVVDDFCLECIERAK